MAPKPVIAEPIAIEVISADWPIRLLVNRQYLPFLKENGLLQGDTLLNLPVRTLVKQHYHRGVCDRIVDRVLLGSRSLALPFSGGMTKEQVGLVRDVLRNAIEA